MALAIGGVTAFASVAPDPAQELADLSLEDLVSLEITSVGRKEARLFESPAAIAVVNNEDVRRLGITSLPEALRLVPGMNVGRINGNQWAISPRGFNFQFADKLLVLIDGRSVYTPSFGGVIWEAQDIVLEDLDRIEVIRGPGAALWGANAVNGVVNITSKNSRDTQGTLVSASVGSEDRPSVTLRHGGELAPDLHFRVYLKQFDRRGFMDAIDGKCPDDWNSIRGGFRADWEPRSEDLVTVQADLYSLEVGEFTAEPLQVPPFFRTVSETGSNRGGNLTGRWTRTFSDESHASLQLFADWYERSVRLTTERRETGDIDWEHRFAPARGHDIVWGLGYRFSRDRFQDTPTVRWDPASRDTSISTGFLQDEITLVPGRFKVTVGSKFERNVVTGLEIQPSLRALWMPSTRQTVWAAASRAVSTPSRIARDVRFDLGAFQPAPDQPVFVTTLLGNKDLESEKLDAYEMGYRAEATSRLTIEIAGFYNRYVDLIESVMGPPQFGPGPGPESPPRAELPTRFQNVSSGHTYGAEIAAEWSPLERWRVNASWSWLELRLPNQIASGSPRYQAGVRSFLELPGSFELNTSIVRVGKTRPYTNAGSVTIAAFTRLDVGLVWHRSSSVELGIWGHNLLDPRHPEFASFSAPMVVEVPRTVMARLALRF